MFVFALKSAGLRAAALLLLPLAALLLALPAWSYALPVAVEQVEERHSLKHSAFFLVNKRGEIGILEASSPLRQNQYSRLEDGIPIKSEGALWLRFSLIKNNQALMRPLPEGARQPLFLDLGRNMREARLYVAESVSTDGEIKTWREAAPLGSGHFALPEPELLPLTVYMRLPGIPSLWFNPMLVRGEADSGLITWTLIMQIALGLALAVVLVRGMAENDEWRFWAGAVLVCAIIPTLLGQYGSDPRIVYLADMPRLLAPGLAVMLMPHLGRYLLNSRGVKALDYTLIAFSVLGVAVALAPLTPGLGWTARLLPLAPLLLLPLVLVALVRARGGQSGALLYFFFTLFPFIGALLALLPLLTPRFAYLEPIGPSLTVLGYLVGGWLLALGKPSGPKEKGDFFPLNDIFEDGALSMSHAAKSTPKRDVCAPLMHLDELADGPPLSVHLPDGGPECEEADEAEGAQAGAPPLKEHLAALDGIFEPLQGNNGAARPEVIDLGLDVEVFADDMEEADEAQGAEEETTAPAPEDAEAGDESLEAESFEPQNAAAQGLELKSLAAESAGGENTDDAGAPETAEYEAAEYLTEAATPMRQDENIIYIKDEEEPGLVILKPAGPAPIKGLARVRHNPARNLEYTAISRLESALRAPYQQLVQQLDELRSRQDLAADHAEGLGKSLDGLGLMLDNLERLARGEALSAAPSQTIFNLAHLIRGIHEEALPLAEERGLTLSWFVAPGLPAYFKGLEQDIAEAVKLLLHGALDGAGADAPGGAVQLSVRQGSGASSGQIQFSLQEIGPRHGQHQRPSGWLNKAWELAAASGGSFNIDFIPGKGMALTLALPLVPVPEAPVAPGAGAENGAALAEFAPGPEPEGAEDPIPGLPSIEEENDADVLLLTDTILPATKSPPPKSPLEDAPQPEPKPAPEAESLAEDAPKPEQEQDIIIISDDEIMDIPAPPRPAAARPSAAPQTAPELAPQTGPREYIIIADMAASGRRLLARRLEGLPHKLLEAKNADEIVRAAQRNPVGLIILDADMPEGDVKKALTRVEAHNREHSLPPTPSLCILAHESQAERMTRAGCSETQIKAASRTQFRQAVLRLSPHPKADPVELLPESPLLRAAARQNTPQPGPVTDGRPGGGKARVPMLDMIVASLNENGTGRSEPKHSEPGHSGPDANRPGENGTGAGGIAQADLKPIKSPYPLLSMNGEKMEAERVAHIPGLLVVLEDSLEDLAAARARQDAEYISDIAVRMSGQGRTFGLQTLERMARCVERAAKAEEAEAVRDFSGELLALGRRYLESLKETHADYLKKKK